MTILFLQTDENENARTSMQKRHFDREQYFKEQEYTTKKHVIPFIRESLKIDKDTSVLEIGCGEGGNLKPFLDLKCGNVVGIDLSVSKIENAQKFYQNHPDRKHIQFIAEDIFNAPDIGRFKLIMTRDTLEHIHDQKVFLDFLKILLKPDGQVFLGFPPWQNPFGGHQQMCESRFLSKIPYFHLLPVPVYRFILKSFGEKEAKITGLLEIKKTRISIEKFERLLKETGFAIHNRTFYSINPHYEAKFNLKPRKQCKLISSIPYLRNFLTTANYYMVSPQYSSST